MLRRACVLVDPEPRPGPGLPIALELQGIPRVFSWPMTPLHDPKVTEGRGHRRIEHPHEEQMVLPRRDLHQGPDRSGEEHCPHEDVKVCREGRHMIAPRWPGPEPGQTPLRDTAITSLLVLTRAYCCKTDRRTSEKLTGDTLGPVARPMWARSKRSMFSACQRWISKRLGSKQQVRHALRLAARMCSCVRGPGQGILCQASS